MQRDPALVPLARDHHAALVLARRASRATAAEAAALAAELAAWFAAELDAHFQLEEARLLPALAARGAAEAVARTEAEHGTLRALAARLAAGDDAALASFGTALNAHVRYEDRELFPLAEALIPSAELAAVMGV